MNEVLSERGEVGLFTQSLKFPKLYKELAVFLVFEMDFKGRHIISIDDFSKDEILHILAVAKEMEKNRIHLLKDKVMATLFFEPSTRTRLSHETSMITLGGKVIGFSDPSSSSHRKLDT